jgi:hypothetical protein
MLSTLAPQISLTNKTAPIDGLDVAYSATTYKNLLQNRVLLVRKKLGFQVVKGISTDTGAFRQISVRRIVDYAKTGVRSGSDPYIGRLNNARVRAALKATLDGFLSQMVLDEMLVGYELDVTATRRRRSRDLLGDDDPAPDVLDRLHPRDHEPPVGAEKWQTHTSSREWTARSRSPSRVGSRVMRPRPSTTRTR